MPDTIEDFETLCDSYETRIKKLEAGATRLRDALKMIAGYRQCANNLMSNAKIAQAALLEGDTNGKSKCSCGNKKLPGNLWCTKCHSECNIKIHVPPHHKPQEVIAEHVAFQNKQPAEQAAIIQREREGRGFKI